MGASTFVLLIFSIEVAMFSSRISGQPIIGTNYAPGTGQPIIGTNYAPGGYSYGYPSLSFGSYYGSNYPSSYYDSNYYGGGYASNTNRYDGTYQYGSYPNYGSGYSGYGGYYPRDLNNGQGNYLLGANGGESSMYQHGGGTILVSGPHSISYGDQTEMSGIGNGYSYYPGVGGNGASIGGQAQYYPSNDRKFLTGYGARKENNEGNGRNYEIKNNKEGYATGDTIPKATNTRIA